MSEPQYSGNYCFACGRDNPIGLHLDFSEQDGKYVAVKTLPKEFQSYNGILHGGIVTTLLDEAMGGMLYEKEGAPALTAKLEVRYHHPTPIGEELTIVGWEESRRRNMVNMQAEIKLADGTVTAEASAKMMIQ